MVHSTPHRAAREAAAAFVKRALYYRYLNQWIYIGKSRSNGYRGLWSVTYPISYDLPIISYDFPVIG